MNHTQTAPGAQVPARAPSRVAWLLAGALGAASLGAGASLLMRQSAPAVPASTAPAEGRAALAASVPPVAQAQPVVRSAAPDKSGSPTTQLPAAGDTSAAKAPGSAPAAACGNCGVVESVSAVTRKGEGSGVGAVAGGVLGAVVGNQMGKGDGRKAMTVLGAVGGGLAGHEVEKHSKSSTVHRVKVRMDDGSLRTVEQAQAPRPGDRVKIEGGTLRQVAGAVPPRG